MYRIRGLVQSSSRYQHTATATIAPCTLAATQQQFARSSSSNVQRIAAFNSNARYSADVAGSLLQRCNLHPHRYEHQQHRFFSSSPDKKDAASEKSTAASASPAASTSSASSSPPPSRPNG